MQIPLTLLLARITPYKSMTFTFMSHFDMVSGALCKHIDHFNSILTSLQGLADSISADFDQLDANDHLVDVNKIE